MKLMMRNKTLPMLLVILVAGSLTVPAAASDGREKHHPGYVDGTVFSELADPNGQLIEVNLRGKLLKLLSTRAVKRHDEGLANILGELVSVQAVIAEIDKDGLQEAREAVKAIEKKLERDKWERFVRVRDKGEEFTAYVYMDEDDEVQGLLVIGYVDKDELIFVNLAGRIDMERIALLGERLGVPTLDDLPPFDEYRDERRDEDPSENRVR